MGDCIDKRIADLLYPYELGVLSEEQIQQFELHLLECPSCSQRALRFADAAMAIKRDRGLRESVRQLAESDTKPTGEQFAADEPGRPSKRLWPMVVPPLMAAAVLLILLLTDWQVDIRPRHEAAATENKLAVMYFENLAPDTGAQRLGEIAANLLISDLAESQYLQVVSSQRLFDILKTVDEGDGSTSSRDIAAHVARKTEAKFLLTGAILQTHPQLEIATQLIDVSSGDVLSSPRISGGSGDDIFSVIDKLTVIIKKELSLPPAALTEPDQQIARITTSSADAYWYYLEGVDYARQFYTDEATTSLSKAVERDSTFAMAYYHLSALNDRQWIDKAMRLLDRAGTREQFLIRSRYAAYHGDQRKAKAELQQLLERYPEEKDAFFQIAIIDYNEMRYTEVVNNLQRVLAIDSTFKLAYNQLAYAYDHLGDFEHALPAADMYVALAPNEANPHDTRGEICANNGLLEQAIASYERAIQIRPQFAGSMMRLGVLYLFQQDYEEARRSLQEFVTNCERGTCPAARVYFACMPLYQGKLDSALQLLEYGIGADLLELPAPAQNDDHIAKYILRARIFAEQNKPKLALKEFERYIEIHRRNSEVHHGFRKIHAELLIAAGKLDEAEEIATSLRTRIGESNIAAWRYWYARGCLNMARDSAAAAVEDLQRSVAIFADFTTRFKLAQTQFAAGYFADAAKSYEFLLTSYTMARALEGGVESAKLHYHLARTYQELERRDEAVEQYELFLDSWRDADPGLDAVMDAKKQLAQLRVSS